MSTENEKRLEARVAALESVVFALAIKVFKDDDSLGNIHGMLKDWKIKASDADLSPQQIRGGGEAIQTHLEIHLGPMGRKGKPQR